MAILPAMQAAAVRLLGRKPSTFFGASGTFELEIADLVNEAAEDIAQYQDWQALVRIGSITAGSDVDLPADYARMLLNSEVMDPANWVWGYTHYDDLNTYLFDKARGFAPQPGGWIIYGGQMHFSPVPSGAAQFPYVSRNWARAADGSLKAVFDSDTDSFVLPERLLTLWLVWRWRENKGQMSAGDQEAFVKALDEYAAKDKGSQIIRRGGIRRVPNTSIAYSGMAI